MIILNRQFTKLRKWSFGCYAYVLLFLGLATLIEFVDLIDGQ
jgi:hypothetical protein